jgi:signal transduction histidine kinase
VTFRAQVALALAIGAIVPVGVLGVGLRREMTVRLEEQTAGRVAALRDVLGADVAAQAADVRRRLGTLAAALASDTRFRLAVRGEGADRRWLLDWAGGAMAGSGLAALRLEDDSGQVLSSGHFRNEFGRRDPGPFLAIAAAPDRAALVRFRTPDADLRVLASADSLAVGGRRYRLIGGRSFDPAGAAALVPPEEMAVALVVGAAGDSADAATAAVTVPFYDGVTGDAGRVARLVVTPNPEPLRALRRSVDRRLAVAAGLTLLLIAVLTVVLAARVSRPLAELADKTSRVDLDRLEVDFTSDRGDEIGALGNLLAAMTARLRASTVRLLEAERRATTGDLARQINHDVKNGLAPIRHVLRHLTETAVQTPDQLTTVFAERRATLESSLTYLEDLARNYARLAPAPDVRPSDLGALLREVARAVEAEGVELVVRVPEALPPARADGVVLRRIVENLARNAVEALDGRPGRVTLASEPVRDGSEPMVRLAVSDTGRGMTQAELDRAFADFHTTKPAGTGLGLSVVRRLVGDLGGRLRVETAPGSGSTFTVEIPSA